MPTYPAYQASFGIGELIASFGHQAQAPPDGGKFCAGHGGIGVKGGIGLTADDTSRRQSFDGHMMGVGIDPAGILKVFSKWTMVGLHIRVLVLSPSPAFIASSSRSATFLASSIL